MRKRRLLLDRRFITGEIERVMHTQERFQWFLSLKNVDTDGLNDARDEYDIRLDKER